MTTRIRLANSSERRGLIISGTHTSVGKSSISIGLMRLFTRLGHKVTPFKIGPDFIDPGHHARACGRQGYNLDSWMCSKSYLKSLFEQTQIGGDLSIIEGVMGLFDGAYSKKETGTTAEIAKNLKLPVILVFDGSTMARSAAALVKGYCEFDNELNILGVIANRVNSPGHAKILRDAIQYHTGIKFLGYLPQRKELEIPSRYLGLHQNHETHDKLYELWADHIERHLNVKELLDLNKTSRKKGPAPSSTLLSRWNIKKASKEFCVAVARDEAFPFIYQDTLDFFQHCGGSVKFFSPLVDSKLPEGIDWIYIPGGYPEIFAKKLSVNKSLNKEIFDFGKSGNLIVGECGGLMYLGKSLIDQSGEPHKMVGLFDFSTTVEKKKLAIGYRKLHFQPSPSSSSISISGHEFHYASFLKNNETPIMTSRERSKRIEILDGFSNQNCFGFFTHIYWGTSLNWFRFLLKIIQGKYSNEKKSRL